MNFLVSVIIPAYNVEKYLEECILSVINQSYQNLEIIVINDGSTDGTKNICEKFAEKDRRIKVINNHNSGVSTSRNIGVKMAEGDYIAFVDSDDYVDKDYVQKLLDSCIEHNTSMSVCNHYICRKGNKYEKFSCNSKIINQSTAFSNLLYSGVPDVSSWGKLYQKDLIKSITYPDGKICDDTYTIAEIISKVEKISYLPESLYYYRIREESLSRGIFDKSKLDYISAVFCMTETILQYLPETEKDVLAKQANAYLSVRRYLVDCEKSEYEIRKEIDINIKKRAKFVVFNRKFSVRDKVGAIAILLNTKLYDLLWNIYENFIRR